MKLPLKGITVLEFSQYLSGPVAGLRLADFGARVIKIERPKEGEAGRHLAIKNLWVDNNSLLFHTINRNKDSFAANLKDPEDLSLVKKWIVKADVLTHNCRPGVMENLGLDFESVKAINHKLIYVEISGYGKNGPWCKKPGQDLLIQSISGLTYTTGNKNDDPTPFGLGIADFLCGNQAVQAILAALVKRQKTGKGVLLELSLLESLLDFQFELLTTYFYTGNQPDRSTLSNGHPLLSAPYGIYQTKDGYIAIAMMPLKKLNEAIECPRLNDYSQEDAFMKRDEIKSIIIQHLKTKTTSSWLKAMRKIDIWAMPVLNWQQMRQSSTYQEMKLEQKVFKNGKTIFTTRCPIRFNDQLFLSKKPAPEVGEQTGSIKELIEKKS